MKGHLITKLSALQGRVRQNQAHEGHPFVHIMHAGINCNFQFTAKAQRTQRRR